MHANRQRKHPARRRTLRLSKVPDFRVTGTGSARAWSMTEWSRLTRVGSVKCRYSTRFKALYSGTGIYFLAECEDRRLSCADQRDFEDLYLGDVLEVFLQPDKDVPVYLEYELSPLGRELPVLVPNFGGNYEGWLPWHYTGKRRVRKVVKVRGGKAFPGATVKGWSAEFFIPFDLLKPLGPGSPAKGSSWRFNFYRVDHDAGRPAKWAWCAAVGRDFHDFRNFGRLVFQ